MAQLTLYVLRHAKSSWAEPGMHDFDRPLAPRGRREAADVAALMTRRGYLPDRILCSTALRTRETLGALLPVLSANAEITLTKHIYETDTAGLVQMIRKDSGEARALMLVGHNPAMEELARLLAGDGDVTDRLALNAKFPPAGLAVIRFATGTWSEIGAGTGHLAAFHTPAAQP